METNRENEIGKDMQYILDIIKIALGFALLWALIKNKSLATLFDFSKKTSKGIDPDECSFCSKHRHDVTKLVAGDNGAICPDCLLSSIPVFDSSSDDNPELAMIDKIIIEKMDVAYKEASEESLDNYIFSPKTNDIGRREKVFDELCILQNSFFVKKWLSCVPREEWKAKHVIGWIWANFNEGDFESALTYPEIRNFDKTFPEPAYDRFLKLNRISVQIEMANRHDEIRKFINELNALLKEVESDSTIAEHYSKSLIRGILAGLANCHYLVGNNQEALSYLEKNEEISEPDVFTEWVSGCIYEKMGQSEVARTHWEKGQGLSFRNVFSKRIKEKLAMLAQA